MSADVRYYCLTFTLARSVLSVSMGMMISTIPRFVFLALPRVLEGERRKGESFEDDFS